MASGARVGQRVREAVRALLGVSAYEQPHGYGAELDDDHVREIRAALGGQLQPLITTRLRWYLADLETAQSNADAGNLLMAAQLYRAMRRDGKFAGLLGTRTGGLLALPKKFYGDAEIAEALRANNGSRSVFDEMYPPAELALMDADGIVLGASVGELVPVEGRAYPVLVRLAPENLLYRWQENRWYFKSVAGLLPITPGDGRWVLHSPGGRMQPWAAGLWPALGRAFINKEHALMARANYSSKLANAARAAIAPPGATEGQRNGFFKKLLGWGLNTVFEMPPGWDVKLIESNGRGWEVFQSEIDTSDGEYMVGIAGQVVTTTGGAGFSNAAVPEAIRDDLIATDGESLAYTINTQCLPMYIASVYGVDAISTRTTSVQWDTAKPKELEGQARTFLSLAQAVRELVEVLSTTDRRLDLDELATRYALPLRPANDSPANTPDLVVVRDREAA